MCYFQAHISIESLFLSNVKILSTPKLVNLSSNVKSLALKKVNPPFKVLQKKYQAPSTLIFTPSYFFLFPLTRCLSKSRPREMNI